MNCFSDVKFKTSKVLVIWHLKHELFQKRDVQNMKCFRYVTFRKWNVSETWGSEYANCFSDVKSLKHERFQKHDDIQYMKCFRNVTLKTIISETWNVSEMCCSKHEVFEHVTPFCCPRSQICSKWSAGGPVKVLYFHFSNFVDTLNM